MKLFYSDIMIWTDPIQWRHSLIGMYTKHFSPGNYLQNSWKLGISHACLLPGGADGAGPDADLDDVGPGEEELLHHLPSHHVAGQDGVLGVGGPDLPHVHHEVLWVPVSHVQADKLYLRHSSQDGLQPRENILQ